MRGRGPRGDRQEGLLRDHSTLSLHRWARGGPDTQQSLAAPGTRLQRQALYRPLPRPALDPQDFETELQSIITWAIIVWAKNILCKCKCLCINETKLCITITFYKFAIAFCYYIVLLSPWAPFNKFFLTFKGIWNISLFTYTNGQLKFRINYNIVDFLKGTKACSFCKKDAFEKLHEKILRTSVKYVWKKTWVLFRRHSNEKARVPLWKHKLVAMAWASWLNPFHLDVTSHHGDAECLPCYTSPPQVPKALTIQTGYK